jgi:anti-sigma regulatory factor (Ser/Thr protein kinase)
MLLMDSDERVAPVRGRSSGGETLPLARGGRGQSISRHISVQLESGPPAVGAARTAIDCVADRVEAETLEDVRLLVSELVTNSIRHSGTGESSQVRLDLLVSPETLRVEVADAGSGFEPRPRVRGQSKGSGWGLYLVDRLADRWGVVNDRLTRVWFEIDRRRRAAA